MSGYDSLQRKRLAELKVETDDEDSRPGTPTAGYSGFFDKRASLNFNRASLTPKIPPPEAAPPPPPPAGTPPPDDEEAAVLPSLELLRSTPSSANSTPSSSPTLGRKFPQQNTKKKAKAPLPPSAAVPLPPTTSFALSTPPSKAEVVAATAVNVTPSPRTTPSASPRVQDAFDPTMDIERPVASPRTGNGVSPRSDATMDRDIYYNDEEFPLESLSRASSQMTLASTSRAKILRFREVNFKEFSQRGFLVPTWYVGYLQMTVGIATAILAMTEILVPTGSDTEYNGSTRWFTLKQFNIYGFSFISSLALTVAGCYLVRAQTKNDLDVIKSSAGYSALSIIFHIAAFAARFTFLWMGKIAPYTIGIQMYVTSLCIIVLTMFGFWISALGFGVYALFAHNHTQQVDSVEDLHKETVPVLDLLDRYMGVYK